jgi:hypothetical protein
MPTVYFETTIPSYLASRPSRDLVAAAHQQITHEWWTRAKSRFDLFVSEAVLEECRAGDPDAAARRLEILQGLPVLALKEDVRALVRIYSARLGLPPQAGADVLHIAFAVGYELDYLVTWNCRHIANGEVIYRLIEINSGLGKHTPLILTPEELG